jgi:hypothetical protein
MPDLNAIHRKLCPKKHLGNFWKSSDYMAVVQVLDSLGVPEAEAVKRSGASRGHPARTIVHPLVALAFTRWVDAAVFYRYLHKVANPPSADTPKDETDDAAVQPS